MTPLVVFLLLTALLFGLGFAVKIMWYIALFMLVVWLVGLVAHPHDRRWYRW